MVATTDSRPPVATGAGADRMPIVLAVLGLLLVSAGTGLWNVPAGLIVAGLLCMSAAYVSAYLKARTTP